MSVETFEKIDELFAHFSVNIDGIDDYVKSRFMCFGDDLVDHLLDHLFLFSTLLRLRN